jgi:hypothetical protein
MRAYDQELDRLSIADNRRQAEIALTVFLTVL